MKLMSLILNVIVSPLLVVAGIYYFYTQDIREAILLALIFTTISTFFQLFFKLFKIIFSTLTFNFAGALKNLAQILTSIGVLILYWLSYYFYYGANFSNQLF